MSLVPAPHTGSCANCGAPLEGRYCGACGQRHEPHVHSVAHFAGEALESISHADSRLWLTLRLLLTQPGRLTRDFFDGKRARYLPPFRLYLVISVLFFLIIGAPDMTPPDPVTAKQGVGLLGEVAADIERDFKADNPVADAAPDLLRDGVEDLVAPVGETAEQRVARLCGAKTGAALRDEHFIERFARDICRRTVPDNGAAFARAFVENLPRAMFLFLPLLALFIKLLYWRPRRFYVEHLLFLVHNHAFVFLLLLLTGIFVRLPWHETITGAFLAGTPAWLALHAWRSHRSAAAPRRAPSWRRYVWLSLAGVALGTLVLNGGLDGDGLLTFGVFSYMTWYFYRGMRAVYGQARGRTVAKFLLIGLAYVFVSGFVLALTGVYSAATA